MIGEECQTIGTSGSILTGHGKSSAINERKRDNWLRIIVELIKKDLNASERQTSWCTGWTSMSAQQITIGQDRGILLRRGRGPIIDKYTQPGTRKGVQGVTAWFLVDDKQANERNACTC